MIPKKISLSVIMILLLASNLFAQSPEYPESGIKFFQGSWDEAKAKAKAENKLIFVDAYTVWCGPCKMMTANTFPAEAVGTFYNANFISIKLDMEKAGDGLNFAKTYKVNAFPTLLFIDENGTLVHKAVGFKDVDSFIALGKTAIDPKAGLVNLEQEYKMGNRQPDFILKYMNAMLLANIDIKEIADWYFATQPHESLITADDFTIISKVVNDYNDPIFNFVFKHQTEYMEQIGVEKVNKYLHSVFLKNLLRDALKSEDEFSIAKSKIRNYDFIGIEKVISTTEVLSAYHKKDLNDFVQKSAKHIKLYSMDDAHSLASLSNLLLSMPEATDDDLKKALNWSEHAVKLKNSFFQNFVYTSLLYKLGKNKKALKAANKTLEMTAKDDKNYKTILALIDKIETEL